jgi:hypothetical protein
MERGSRKVNHFREDFSQGPLGDCCPLVTLIRPWPDLSSDLTAPPQPHPADPRGRAASLRQWQLRRGRDQALTRTVRCIAATWRGRTVRAGRCHTRRNGDGERVDPAQRAEAAPFLVMGWAACAHRIGGAWRSECTDAHVNSERKRVYDLYRKR